jgi:hypothetical protein
MIFLVRKMTKRDRRLTSVPAIIFDGSEQNRTEASIKRDSALSALESPDYGILYWVVSLDIQGTVFTVRSPKFFALHSGGSTQLKNL